MSTQPRAHEGAVYKEDNLVKILNSLSARGWVPLSHMATILGYAHQESIFIRQKTSRAIPFVKVGGIKRVIEAHVIELLEEQSQGNAVGCTPERREYAKSVLNIYRRISNG